MVRVHESYDDGTGVCFNLDDMAQFYRYRDVLAVTRDTAHEHTFSDGGELYLLESRGNGVTVKLYASPIERHADCEYCRLNFDATAGNATTRQELWRAA